MNSGPLWTLRGVALLLSVALLSCSWRLAWADFLAYANSNDTRMNLERAVLLEPDNADYILKKALMERDDSTASIETLRSDFKKVLKLNPHSTEALLSLGLLEQREGNVEEAESYLLKAEDYDHTFKPVWTLTNFYFQTDQFQKMWPRIQRCLKIASPDLPGLTRFAADPIFELCWRAGASAQQILDLTPKTPALLLAYFFNTLGRKNWDAALLVLPLALPFADPSETVQSNALSAFCWGLLEAHRVRDSVQVWNLLVEKGIIKSTLLNVGTGQSMADSDLRYAPSPTAFGWVLNPESHLDATYYRGLIQIALDGREPEELELVSKNLPVLSGRTYILTWKTALEHATETDVQGVSPLIEAPRKGRDVDIPCSSSQSSSFLACRFTVPGDAEMVRMRMMYRRTMGVVRLKGTVQLSGFHLKLVE